MFAPTGAKIIAILEVVQVKAGLDNVKRTTEGALIFEYNGINTLDAATQSPITHEGQRVFVCERNELWRESQLTSIQKAA